MKVTRVSPVSGIERTIELDISEEQFRRMEQGEFIQDVCPNLTEDEREFYMSGLWGNEWDELFDTDDGDYTINIDDEDDKAF